MAVKTVKKPATQNYHLVCGMEVHAELKTNSKMFCGCKNDPFHAAQPNIHTCPVCLGMPGGLPVANQKAIEWTIKLGLALGCKINLFSHFDRKHYFYPDLPKGYQISQYDQPFCYDGVLETEFGPVRIRRIHLEEDTGKLLHQTVDGQKVSLIDFNRGGVPLVEIVTEPDIKTAEQAKIYGKQLRQVLRFLDIADCDMEQGGMRLEANVSVQAEGETELPPYKVELKNINSFRFLEKAIQYEVTRQTEVLTQGETPTQETRGWNEAKSETYIQRSKEDAEDYRYFPDPDLPPLRFTEQQLAQWRSELPELPHQLFQRWQAEFGIESRYTEVLIENQSDANWAQKLWQAGQAAQVELNKLANALANRKVAFKVGDDVTKLIQQFAATQQTDTVDEAELAATITAVLAENPDAVDQFKNGKTQVIGFFIGQVSRKLGKKLNPQELYLKIQKALTS